MTTNGDNRLLSDIEGMEQFMADERGWTRCRGCLRLRSTTDRNDVCDQCRPGAADGSIVLASRNVDTPVPARLLPDDHMDDDTVPPEAEADERASVTVVVDVDTPAMQDAIRQAVADAEPKQRPVKRRWYRRRK